MNQLKKTLVTAGASLVLSLGMTGAAGATSQQPGGSINNSFDKTKTVNVDRSQNVNGNCSAIIQTDVSQSQEASNDTHQLAGNVGGNVGFGNDNSQSNGQSSSSSNSQSQSADVNFAPDCSTSSTTNVTQLAAAPAAAAPAAKQVVAPTGGVHAGGGAGVSSASSAASIAGLTASAGSLGLGVVLRKKSLLGL